MNERNISEMGKNSRGTEEETNPNKNMERKRLLFAFFSGI